MAFVVEAHLRFVTIHPFEDGYGRLSRLLMNLVHMKRGYTPVWIPPFCKSEYFARVRHYQTVTTESSQLLELVVNDVMAAFEVIIQEAQAAPV